MTTPPFKYPKLPNEWELKWTERLHKKWDLMQSEEKVEVKPIPLAFYLQMREYIDCAQREQLIFICLQDIPKKHHDLFLSFNKENPVIDRMPISTFIDFVHFLEKETEDEDSNDEADS